MSERRNFERRQIRTASTDGAERRTTSRRVGEASGTRRVPVQTRGGRASGARRGASRQTGRPQSGGKAMNSFIALAVSAVLVLVSLIVLISPKKTNNTNRNHKPASDFLSLTADNTSLNEVPGFGIVNGYEPIVLGTEKNSEGEPENVYFAHSFDDNGVKIANLGLYYGPYFEDGSDKVVTDCLAAIITNTGKELISSATVKVKVGETEAVFELSYLPAGKSCLVLEQNKATYKNNDKLEALSADVTRSNMSMASNLVASYNESTLYIKNNSFNTIKDVYVMYKYNINGLFFGGISYRCSIDSIEAGVDKSCVANHYVDSYSDIVFATFIEEKPVIESSQISSQIDEN